MATSAVKIASKNRRAYRSLDANRDELSIQMTCRLPGWLPPITPVLWLTET